MDDIEDRKETDPGNPGVQPKTNLAVWPTESQNNAHRVAEPKLPLKVRLDLHGRGHLGGHDILILKKTIAERGTPKGYGFAFEYKRGRLEVAMEQSSVPADAIGRDPVSKFESDIGALLKCLPPNFDAHLVSTLIVRTGDNSIRHFYRSKRGGSIAKRVTIEAADAKGSSHEEQRLPIWNDPRLTIPIIAIGTVIIALLFWAGILHFPANGRATP